jgi:hypothetical protein
MESVNSGLSWFRSPVGRAVAIAVVLLLSITMMVGMFMATTQGLGGDNLGAGDGDTVLAGASWSGPYTSFVPATSYRMGASWS